MNVVVNSILGEWHYPTINQYWPTSSHSTSTSKVRITHGCPLDLPKVMSTGSMAIRAPMKISMCRLVEVLLLVLVCVDRLVCSGCGGEAAEGNSNTLDALKGRRIGYLEWAFLMGAD